MDKFIVGRFTSHTRDGCPDGYMTIAETTMAATVAATTATAAAGGQWCGTAWGYNVYYSEGGSINVSLHVLRLHQQQGLPDNFAFRLTYKVLRRADAKLR